MLPARLRHTAFALFLLIAVLIADPARAACTTPAGAAGAQIYNSTYNVMQYCNGTDWVNMGSQGSVVGLGTLTANDFCTSDGSVINCTTAAISLTTQVSGTLQAAQFPALTGDVTTSAGSLATTVGKINGVALGSTSATAGNVLIGSGTQWVSNAVSGDITISSGGVTAIGNAKVTNAMLAGSIALSKLSTTGTPDGTKFLRDDGAWTAVSSSPVGQALTSDYFWLGNGSNVAAAVQPSGDVTITNAGVTAIGSAKVTNAMLAGSIDLTSKVTGTLPVANGGTGVTALTGFTSAITTTGILTGASLVPSGSTAATNGVYLPAANTIAISANSLDVARFATAASAVNYFTLTPAATGAGPALAVAGSDTNVDININAKGTGTVKHTAQAAGAVAVTIKGAASQTGDLLDFQNSSGTVLGAVTSAGALTTLPSIGIGTNAVASTAVLDMVSTTKGMLPPRMTTTQRDAISSPATGLAIYNTTTNALNLFNGTSWGAVAGQGSIGTDSDVTLTSVANNDILYYNSGTSKWVNGQVGSVVAGVAGPSFSVHKNGTNQTVSTNTWTKMTWSTEVFDTNNNFASDKFTPTVAGKYIFTLSGYCPDTTTQCQVAINKNGSTVTYGPGIPSAAHIRDIASVIVDMNGSSDYVEGWIYNGGGTTIDGTAVQTHFEGSMLAPLASGVVAGTGSSSYVPVWTSGNAITYDSTASQMFMWDITNHRLGLGTTAPSTLLHVAGNTTLGGTVAISGNVSLSGTETGATGVGIGTSSVASTAVLDMVSTSKGMLPPRMTTTQRDAITSPATGLTIYNTTTNQMNVYNGTAWGAVGGAASGSDGYVQFTASSALSSDSNFFRDATNHALGIGTTSPSTKAALEIVSTTKGFLPPRMTTTQRDAITSPATGLMIYNTTTAAFEFYTGSAWTPVAGGVPTGTIAAFASASCPAGWSEYTAARGRFLRGIDNGAGNDPDGTRSAGATQADALGSHTHNITDSGLAVTVKDTSGNAGGSYGTVSRPDSGGAASADRALTIGSTGSSETRPKNVAVTFCQYAGTSIASSGITASGTANYVARWSSSTVIGTGTLYDNGSNVGIGTASPSLLLDVYGSGGTSTIFRSSAAGNNTGIKVDNSSVSGGYNAQVWLKNSAREWILDAGGAASGVDSSGAFFIYDQTAPAVRFLINSSGNVGIGTVSPNTNLSVYNGNESTTLTNFTQALTNSGINIVTDYTANAYTPGVFWSSQDNNGTKPKAGIWMQETNSGTNMFLGTSNNYATGITNTAVQIDYSGNVGIGASPSYRLRVSGANANWIAYIDNTTSGGYGLDVYVPNGYAILGQSVSNVYGYLGYATSYGVYGVGSAGGLFVDNVSSCASYVAYASYAVYSGCPNGFSSDARLKKDVKPLNSALETVAKLNPVSFHWKEDAEQAKSRPGLQFGLIAQEVEEVIPEVVGEVDVSKLAKRQDEEGKPDSLNRKLGKTYAVEYQSLIPFALAAIKELKAGFDGLVAKVEKLVAEVSGHDEAIKKLQAENAELRKDLNDLRKSFEAFRAAPRADNDNAMLPSLRADNDDKVFESKRLKTAAGMGARVGRKE